jgi:lysophospholipase L1-like esterase
MRNIFFVGDELVAGHGDPKALGWAGRVAARTLAITLEARFHSLGVPGETTGDLTSRWDEEVLRRLRAENEADGSAGAQNFVVFAIGRGDLTRGVSPTMTRLNVANALDRAHALGMHAMVVGPPPLSGERNAQVAELAALCEDAAGRRGVPFVDMYGPLARHEQWMQDMTQGDGSLPLQSGYGLMAWLVLNSVWHDWLGVEPPS